jgi:hypothetical protein
MVPIVAIVIVCIVIVGGVACAVRHFVRRRQLDRVARDALRANGY